MRAGASLQRETGSGQSSKDKGPEDTGQSSTGYSERWYNTVVKTVGPARC